MNLSAIVWSNNLSLGLEEMLPTEFSQSIKIYEAANFQQVFDLLEKHTGVDMVLTALWPTQIQMLYQIQQLQERYPEVALVAIFDPLFQVLNEGGRQTATRALNQEKHDAESVISRMTPRQRDVLNLLIRGEPNKQIARILGLSESTVKIHCMAIFRELGVNNRTQAAVRGEEIIGKCLDSQGGTNDFVR
ncbi:response regulator transcription factor [Exilibacterium tricleocarpae]|uniref:Response regulator transcription factor n=1 Tax=Exilibacterium tricleocarpae TaxID=2591008 RepID=A0A545SY88_9GAMM|nr:LuxR C-terminal-related transcriptional regulator [Exilibacterium tricleocarpae]TQV69936.1 response regulator transcription factor [Exilibacterium tricleocarpae]